MLKNSKKNLKTSDAGVNKTIGKATTIVVAVSIAVASFAAGVVSSDSMKQLINKQTPISAMNTQPVVTNNGYPGNVQAAIPATNPPVNINPAVQQTQPAPSAEHQQHATDAAKRVSEAVKTGDYSYLFTEVDSKEEIYRIDITEAKYLFESGKALFVDARGPAEYEQGHIKGAVSVPTTATPEEIAKLKDKLAGKVLVTYCHGAGCRLADKSAYKLWDSGYRKIAIFFGGWPKWIDHKYPIVSK